MTDTDNMAIEEMARQNCHIEYHMKNYKTCKECYETNYCACRVYEVCRNLYNEGYRKQSGWISVEERLPDNNTERVLVLLADDDFTRPIGENKIDTDRFVDGKWVRWWRFVTHWMPLPEPPKMKGVSHD